MNNKIVFLYLRKYLYLLFNTKMLKKGGIHMKKIISLIIFSIFLICTLNATSYEFDSNESSPKPSITLGEKLTIKGSAIAAEGDSRINAIGGVGLASQKSSYTYDKIHAKAGTTNESITTGENSVTLRRKHHAFAAVSSALKKHTNRQGLTGELHCEGWVNVGGDCNIWSVTIRIRGVAWGIMISRGNTIARSGNLVIDGAAQPVIVANAGDIKLINVPIKIEKTLQVASFSQVDTFTIDWVGYVIESFDDTGYGNLMLYLTAKQYVTKCSCIDPSTQS